VGFAQRRAAGTGEPLAVLLRSGNTVTGRVAVIRAALAQLPGYGAAAGSRRPGKNELIRADEPAARTG
jgi:hypothetical protein